MKTINTILQSIILLCCLIIFSCQPHQSGKKHTAVNKTLPDTITIENLYVTSHKDALEYQPELMFDGKMQTSWMSASGNAIDEGIKITFSRSFRIGGIIISWCDKPNCLQVESLHIYTNHNEWINSTSPQDTIYINDTISMLYLQINKLFSQKKIRANGNKFQPATYLLKTELEKKIGIKEISLLNMDTIRYIIKNHNFNSKSATVSNEAGLLKKYQNRKITNLFKTENAEIRYSISIKSDYTINQSITSYEQKQFKHILRGGFWELLNESNNKITLAITNRVLWNTENKTAVQKKENQIIIDTIIINKNTIMMNENNLFVEPEPATLVDLSQLNDNFAYDMRYATKNNFVGEVLYDTCRCLLRYEVAKDIIKANNEFKQHGYHIKFFDCYRPLHVQQKMWDKVPVSGFVANPMRGGSVHNRGGAVDITLVDSSGKELDMGTDFDFFGLKANHTYQNLEPHILKNRNLLKTVMERHNFRAIRSEWWHYSHTKAWHFPVSDQPLGSF